VSDDVRAGLDNLQADMAAHQSRFRGEVSAESNRALAVDTVEKLERKMVDEAGRLQPNPTVVAPPPIEKSIERRDVDGKKYVVSKGPDTSPLLRKASESEHWFMTHAMPRVELLLTKLDTGPLGEPSWNQRVLAVMALKSQANGLQAGGLRDAAADLERRFMFELVQLLNASSATFGDWQKDAPKKVMVG
jgi:hypothetical protein